MLMHSVSCFRHDPFSAVFFYLAGHILLPLRVVLLEAYMLIILSRTSLDPACASLLSQLASLMVLGNYLLKMYELHTNHYLVINFHLIVFMSVIEISAIYSSPR